MAGSGALNNRKGYLSHLLLPHYTCSRAVCLSQPQDLSGGKHLITAAVTPLDRTGSMLTNSTGGRLADASRHPNWCRRVLLHHCKIIQILFWVNISIFSRLLPGNWHFSNVNLGTVLYGLHAAASLGNLGPGLLRLSRRTTDLIGYKCLGNI